MKFKLKPAKNDGLSIVQNVEIELPVTLFRDVRCLVLKKDGPVCATKELKIAIVDEFKRWLDEYERTL
jgi:hypothetical protein